MFFSLIFNSNFDSAHQNIIYERDKQLIDEIIYDPQTVGGLAFIISEQNKNGTSALDTLPTYLLTGKKLSCTPNLGFLSVITQVGRKSQLISLAVKT